MDQNWVEQLRNSCKFEYFRIGSRTPSTPDVALFLSLSRGTSNKEMPDRR
jgi:hypothetical protein